MSVDSQQEFFLSEKAILHFNAWRELTLNLSSPQNIPDDEAAFYNPIRASVNVIEALEEQIGWITAWRIGRYAQETYKNQRFYRDAAANGMDKDSDPAVRRRSEEERNSRQEAVEKTRQKMKNSAKKGSYVPYPAGVKDFDPAMAQTQLRLAAEEFRNDYQRALTNRTGNFPFRVIQMASSLVYIFSDDDVSGEYKKIKLAGNEKFNALFPAGSAEKNASQAGAQVCALFDDQVHDSRAWFLFGALEAREPWGSYFLYRMIYFGEVMSKNITPLVKYGRFVEGRLRQLLPGAAILIERYEKSAGDPGEITSATIIQKVSVISDASVMPLALNNKQLALTAEPQAVTAQRQKEEEAERLAEMRAKITALWS